MKMKNVNFFQRHMEKLVLGTALLIAGLLVLIYVVGNPYAIDIGGRSMGPIAIEEHVEELAVQLDANLNSTTSPLPEMQVPPYTQDFASRVNRRVAPAPYRVAMGPPALDPQDVMPPEPPAPYNLPRPPVTTETVARADHGLLGPLDDVTQQEQFVELVGDEHPQDFRYVSVSGTFDIEQWHQRLASATALPNQFYRSTINIAGVYLQRQTLDPTTGEWGDTTIVQPLPNQLSFLPEFTHDFTDEEAEQYVNFIKQNQARIARPEFPPLLEPTMWLPPWSSVGQLNPEEQREFQKLGESISSLTNRLERLRDRLERAGETTRQNDLREQYQRLQDDLIAAETRRDELIGLTPDMTQRDRMDDPLMDPMMDPGMDPGMADPAAGRSPRAASPRRSDRTPPPTTQAEPSGEDEGTITVWAHDLTVEPGRTYRYRVLVSVLNPLFRQTRVEQSQREVHFNKIALGPDLAEDGEVADAPWSDPVEVAPQHYFFFVQGGQSPRVEVWRIYDGMWRNEEFPVRPGDPIGGEAQLEIDGQPQTVDMTVGAIAVDLLESSSGRTLGGSDTRLLYLAPGSDQIASRSVRQDSDSDDRRRIQNQRTIQQERARQASASRQ